MNTSIYLKEALLAKIKREAKREGVSFSKYVERVLEESLRESIPVVASKRWTALNGIMHMGGDALKDTGAFHE